MIMMYQRKTNNLSQKMDIKTSLKVLIYHYVKRLKNVNLRRKDVQMIILQIIFKLMKKLVI